MRTAIAIDFDGTLCYQDAPYPEIGSPRLAVIEAAKRRRSAGCGLILWTCREGKALEQAIQWCHEYGLDFDVVNDSLPDWKEAYGTNPRKIGATEYWDDKSVNPTAIENKKGEKTLWQTTTARRAPTTFESLTSRLTQSFLLAFRGRKIVSKISARS